MNLPLPGDAWPPLEEQFSRDRIAAYAEAGGDHNPIHVDEEVALAMGLPGVIAHGLLTMAGLARTVTSRLDDPAQLRSLAVRFTGMVRPDIAITYRGTVAEVEGNSAEIDLWAEDGAGTRVLSRGRARIELPVG